MAATLHHLVSSVQSHIIELVLLEEVAGLGPVATPEQVLWGESCQSGPSYSAAHGGGVGWGVSTQSSFLSLELGSIEGNCQSTLTSLWVAPNTKTLPKFCPGSL